LKKFPCEVEAYCTEDDFELFSALFEIHHKEEEEAMKEAKRKRR
jgi:hypothetical protein